MSNITKLYWNELDGTIADVNDIKPIADKVDEVIDEIDIIEDDITEVEDDITEIKDDITEIRDDITEIDASLSTGYQYLKGEFVTGSSTAQKWELWAYNGYFWVSLENNNTETPSDASDKWIKWDNNKTNTVNFNHILSEHETSIQSALDKIDEETYLRTNLPSESTINVIIEKNKKYYEGSGFVEWGANKHDWYDITINKGMYVIPVGHANADKLFLGSHYKFKNGSGDVICHVDGYLIKLLLSQSLSWHLGDMYASFPSPPSSPEQLFKQNLVFLEVWHERLTEITGLGWWSPYGNVHYGSNTFICDNGMEITLDLITDKLGASHQGYSAFGDWDTSTVGYGKIWSELSEVQKVSIMSSKYQNIDIKDDNMYQIKYRIRVLELNSVYNNETGMEIIEAEGTVQGRLSSPSSYKFTREDIEIDAGLCKYESSVYSNNNYTYAIPIAIVSRRNTGAYHPVYNPNGCAKFNDSGTAKYWHEYAHEATWSIDTYAIVGVDTTNKQFKISGDHTDIIKENYYITVSGSTGNDGRYYASSVTYDSGADQTIITVSETIPDTTADGSLKSDYQYVKYCFDNATGGTIESGISGRPDGLYADEINERDVRDLRLPAKTDETLYTEAGVERVMNTFVANEVRGEEYQNVMARIPNPKYGNLELYYHNVSQWYGFFEDKCNNVIGYAILNGRLFYLKQDSSYLQDWGHGVAYYTLDTNERLTKNNITTLLTGNVDLITTESGHSYYQLDEAEILSFSKNHSCLILNNNILFQCDIIGDPANYPQSWKDFGVMGVPLIIDEEENDYLPDGSKTEWKLSRKYSSVKQVIKYSGGVFTLLTETTDYTLDSANNTITFTSAPATTEVIMVFYETYCNALEPVANRNYKNLSNVVVTNCYDVNQGGKLVVDLINKVPTHYNATKNLQYLKLTKVFKDYVSDELLLSYQFYHESILTSYLEASNSVVKAVIYITEQDGLLYPVFIFKEMKYDSTSSSWGDDNKLQITNYVSTMTDSNGKTILYGQKISKIPLGFAKNNIIDAD